MCPIDLVSNYSDLLKVVCPEEKKEHYANLPSFEGLTTVRYACDFRDAAKEQSVHLISNSILYC